MNGLICDLIPDCSYILRICESYTRSGNRTHSCDNVSRHCDVVAAPRTRPQCRSQISPIYQFIVMVKARKLPAELSNFLGVLLAKASIAVNRSCDLGWIGQYGPVNVIAAVKLSFFGPLTIRARESCYHSRHCRVNE